MTIDRTSRARTRRMCSVENNWDRINLESKDLLILDIILENPQGWGGGKVHKIWKIGSPARTKVSIQECQVQGMSQNRTLPQGLPKQEESHPEGSPDYSP